MLEHPHRPKATDEASVLEMHKAEDCRALILKCIQPELVIVSVLSNMRAFKVRKIRLLVLGLALCFCSTESAFGLEVLAEDVFQYVDRLEVVGAMGYAAYKDEIIVMDVSDPTGFVELGRFHLGGGSTWCPWSDHLEVVTRATQTLAFVGCKSQIYPHSQGLVVLDVSDPNNISQLSQIPALDVRGLDVQGDVMVISCACNPSYYTAFYDVSDPAAPVEVSRLYGVNNAYFSNGFAIAGDYFYGRESQTAFFQVLDISDLSNPQVVGVLNSVYPRSHRSSIVIPPSRSSEGGDIAYIAGGATDLHVVDVSEPSSPTLLASLDLPGSYSSGLRVDGKYAYVNSSLSHPDPNYYPATVHKIDVSDPTSPVLVSSVGIPNPEITTKSIEVEGGYIYVETQKASGGAVVISTSSDLVSVVDTPGTALDVEIMDGIAYVADSAVGGLRIIDVSDPEEPSPLSALTGLGDVRDLATGFGIYTFLASGSDYFKVVNVADPLAPVEHGSLSGFGKFAFGLDLSGNQVYLASGLDGVQHVSVSSPAVPTEISSSAPLGSSGVIDLDVVGGIAYVANLFDGLTIVDFSGNPSGQVDGQLDTPGAARAVQMESGFAYVADGSGGLRVVDVSSPSSPSEVAHVDMPGAAIDVEVVEPFAFVSYSVPGMEPSGVRVIDVSDPTSPVVVDDLEVPMIALGLDYSDGYVYVGGGSLGLFTLKFVPPPAAVVPIVGAWGVSFLAGGLLGLGAWRARRRLK